MSAFGKSSFGENVSGLLATCAQVEQFRQRFVEPMGEESDHVHIVALTDALAVPVRVVYLDSHGNQQSADVNTHDFIPEGLEGEEAVPRVVLLYRPGHYDILYRQLAAGAAAAGGDAPPVSPGHA